LAGWGAEEVEGQEGGFAEVGGVVDGEAAGDEEAVGMAGGSRSRRSEAPSTNVRLFTAKVRAERSPGCSPGAIVPESK